MYSYLLGQGGERRRSCHTALEACLDEVCRAVVVVVVVEGGLSLVVEGGSKWVVGGE